MSDELLNCKRIAADVHAGRQTALAVTQAAIDRAKASQERLNPFITITADWARRFAEIVDGRVAAGERPPLAGVPFAIKDLIDMKAVRTTGGSKVLDRRGTEDAEAVRRLIAAGAIPIGKLNMHELAFGCTGANPHFGNCRNPWNPERIPGGSSSGSAVAVAAGICPLTLGSDTGGSIRMPAALCGLVGLKATYGRISRAGAVPLSWSMDHVGPLTRTAEEAALVLRVLAGHDPKDESSSKLPVPDYPVHMDRPLDRLRLGIPHEWFFEDLQPEVADALTAAIDKLAELGVKTVDTSLPALQGALAVHRAIVFSEAATYHRHLLAERGPDYGPDIRPLLQAGLFVTASDYLAAQRVRRQIRDAWALVFRTIDVLVTPSVPMVAPRFDQQTIELPGGPKPLLRACLDSTLPFNVTGHPAVSVPCGFSSEGLPIGMQLVGRPFDEEIILRVAFRYQQATDWHKRRPA